MTPDGAMNPLDQEILGLLADALGPETHATALTRPPGSQMQSIRSAVQSRNWRWVPLLAHISWLLAVITTGAIMTLSAAAVTLALGPESHHSSPHSGSAVPGASAPPASGVGPGTAGGSSNGGGSGSANPGGGTGQGAGGTTGSHTTTTTHGGAGSPAIVSITNPGNHTNISGQSITALTIRAKGGSTPYDWTATGLPAGLSISSETGSISGTPTTACSCSVTVRLDDSKGDRASTNFAWTIYNPVSITSASSTTFTVGQPNTFLVTSSGASTPALSETGPLPLGVSFVDNHNGTATISGAPEEGTAGQYAITIDATNGGVDAATQAFNLSVGLAPPVALELSPSTAMIGLGQSQAFAATGIDASGEMTGDLTASTVFTIAPAGSGSSVGAFCLSGVCSATTPGLYTVTGTDGTLVGNASLQVVQMAEQPWIGTPASGSPKVRAHFANGYYIGVAGDNWTVAVTHTDNRKDNYTGTITLNAGSFEDLAKIRLESVDSYSITGNTLTFSFTNYGLIDGITFSTPPSTTSITFHLQINGQDAAAGQVFFGPFDVGGSGGNFTVGRS